ncbi:DEAD/DEAH box helicase, partial [Paracoccus sp. C2R09]|nr:DEAD/DEAH box helicase [Paracoccus sp. C2R09]
MTKFTDLKLDPKVLKAIAEAGYEQPTPIQAGAIPPALEGRDVLGIAQTGTGKTASFTLPMITMLGRGRARARMPRSLVLCPTRELAAQVAENFDTYAKHTRLTKALLIGGVSFGEQEKLIDRGVDVLIATPGRLLDHFERGKLLLTGVQIMVVDEADRMLDMGFIPDIERIFQLTPFTRQTLFFSATMAPEIERITNTFLHAPERIEIARQATTSETITQRLVELAPPRRDLVSKQKRDLLRALIDAEGEKLTNAIIFCNRKTDVDIVAKSLKKYGYDAAPIHGDLDQSQRTRTLESFRDGGLRLLIASDVAARGLDIPAVSHVFNYDLPSHAEDYVHRIGRTGRAGRLGTAYSIATPSDEKYLTAIESLVKMTLPRAETPEGFQTSSAPVRDARSEDRQEERKSGGTRSRRRGSRRDEQPEQKQDRAEEQPKPQAAERREEPRESNRDNGRDNGRGNGRDDRRDSNRDNGRGGNRREGGRDRGAPVKGMGDHVPQFMLVDLWPKAGVTAEDEVETETAAEAPASVPAPEAEAPKPKRSRSRSRSKSSSKSEEKAAEQTTEATPEAPVEAAVEAPAAPAVEAEPASDTPAAEAAPTEEAPKPKRRSRAKKAET